jgi:hypothetical protein
MQHTFKVGDVVRHKSCNKEGVVMYTHHHDGKQMLVVALNNEGLQLWNSDRVLPPPPHVVMEKDLMVFDDQSYGFRAVDYKTSAPWKPEEYCRVRFQKLSDGTWKIEKVG